MIPYPLTNNLASDDAPFRVKDRHTGENLAGLAADCIKRFGLEDKVMWTYCPTTATNIFLAVARCLHGQCREL